MYSLSLIQHKERILNNPDLLKTPAGRGEGAKTTVSPNMPLGKYGMGIEGYSALNNPEASPISNFFCKGY